MYRKLNVSQGEFDVNYEVRYDLRNPVEWRRGWTEFYADFLRQVEWADANGFSRVTLSEHHFAEDGYAPSTLTVASAIAARTTSIKIALSLVLLPLKHPVQVAEDAAVVDILSGGRLELTVGAGYRPAEFAGYGIAMNERAGRMEEGIEIIKRCWEEERFSHEGRFWSLRDVAVQPKPVQQPRPRIFMGGSSEEAARRAARIADGFNANQPAHAAAWRAEMVRLGKDPGDERQPAVPPGIPSNFLLVAEDPDEAWRTVAPHALYESNTYVRWTAERGNSVYQPADSPEGLRASGTYDVLTPEQVVDKVRLHQNEGNLARLVFHPMMGGMPFDLGQESLQLVVDQVMPALAGS
jgi:alkanesulfonate monooxygenase SsuD/methylene tetrahydromethanopterin reductase-like flavin-dependent oxidoreductase (luciferase family)